MVEDDDLAFYKKISPVFDGKTFEIPPPTLCQDCRRQRRLAWRNMQVVYKRKCDATGEEIISGYPPNSKFKIYKRDYWISDKWNPIDYGRDFDFSKTFFEQLQQLHLAVPKMHLNVVNMENSEFANNSSGCRNCYLIQNSTDAEESMYSLGLFYSNNCFDCYESFESQYCYECVNIEKCYGCLFSNDCVNCSDSILIDNCTGCKNCFGCSSLSNKQYWIYNKASTKEEFDKTKSKFLNLGIEGRDKAISEALACSQNRPKKFAHYINIENSTGDYLHHCKNTKESFIIDNSENIKYSTNLGYAKDMWDVDFWGDHAQISYEMTEVGQTTNILFSRIVYGNCADIYYSLSVMDGSHDCFGCVGLRHAQYCVFNKQYTKSEYEKMIAKIIEHMQKMGEWGQFFPMYMADFAYNETSAQDHYPLSREEAMKAGANWQDEDFSLKYSGEYYTPKDISEYVQSNNPEAGVEINKLLSGVLQCSITQRPFKIQPQELLFYLDNHIQLPDKHPDERYRTRFKKINPQKVFRRQCMCEESGHDHEGRCKVEFETTYAPERKEKVYCEQCYQKSII